MNLDALLQRQDIWQAKQLPSSTAKGIPSGFDLLDKNLPDGGWPSNDLVELLLAQPHIGELNLLLPAMSHLCQQQKRWLAFIAPPYLPNPLAWQQQGLDSRALLLVQTGDPKQQLWAAEQVLKSGTCAMVLHWLDERVLNQANLRRLQFACRKGNSLGVLFRPQQALANASAAPFRLSLQAQPKAQIKIHKRRGSWPSPWLDLNHGTISPFISNALQNHPSERFAATTPRPELVKPKVLNDVALELLTQNHNSSALVLQ